MVEATKPTPRKLALLMSVVGLGLSLSDRVEAFADPNTKEATALFGRALVPGVAGSMSGVLGPADANVMAAAGHAFQTYRPDSLMTAIGERAENAGDIAESDRVADALAMVAIADFGASSAAGMPPERRKEPLELSSPSAIELRQPRPRLPMPEALEWTRSPAPDGAGSKELPEGGPGAQASSTDLWPEAASGGATIASQSRTAWQHTNTTESIASADGSDDGFMAATGAADVSCRGEPDTLADAETLIAGVSHQARVMSSLATLLSGAGSVHGTVAPAAPPVDLDVSPDALRAAAPRSSGVVPLSVDIELEASAAPAVAALVDIELEASAAPVVAALVDIDLDANAATAATPRVDVELDAPVAPMAAHRLAVDIDLDSLATAAAPTLDIELPLGGGAALRPAQAPRAASPLAGANVAISEHSLDLVRGGFSTDTGLQISFGIERAVYVNGSLVTTTSLNVSDLGKVSGGAAQASLSGAAAGITLVQNGVANTFMSGPANSASVGTVVQNTLNDQKIQNVTLINATVNSLQIVKAMNIGSSMRGALIDSLRR